MRLDREDHRAILLELISKSAFPGAAARKVVELQDAIERAEVGAHEPEASPVPEPEADETP